MAENLEKAGLASGHALSKGYAVAIGVSQLLAGLALLVTALVPNGFLHSVDRVLPLGLFNEVWLPLSAVAFALAVIGLAIGVTSLFRAFRTRSEWGFDERGHVTIPGAARRQIVVGTILTMLGVVSLIYAIFVVIGVLVTA